MPYFRILQEGKFKKCNNVLLVDIKKLIYFFRVFQTFLKKLFLCCFIFFSIILLFSVLSYIVMINLLKIWFFLLPTELFSFVYSLTSKCNIESFIWYWKIWNEAQLSPEISIETSIDCWRKLWTSQACQGLGKTTILCNQQVVMMVFQMKGMKVELHTY